ncbi:ABCB family ABC transporter ATP-binding protein/permease [Candidatus Liberibacter americanus]|uniref:Metal ABC transporter permease ATP binding protein n=1 Tax=Candidatus Liberibacter americanus str. Sao Paulo TaxID=1261131 RepID=U6B6C0_9HYPH|nr:ABC transporter ATP-binding protein/permease [Candidatus Liberibacter americanus]AHA28324.1 Metal ABC transporter permease; ATP binding protein [Candidatus Liberibacter americanus str. Sao Paulo]EMS36614.1 ABC transporter related protein [Candidatus Liberibacter americanus PW_SP]
MSSSSNNSLSVLKKIWPYIWPKGSLDLKIRILGSIFFLIASKVMLLGVPFLFKWITDALNEQINQQNTTFHITTGVIVLISSYGTARVLSLIMNQLRDCLFAKAAQGATCKLYHQVVSHIYRLSQRFHVDYKVGKLSAAIGNGTKAIETILRIMVVHLIPTVIEFFIAIAFLWYSYGYFYVAVIAITVLFYTTFTVVTSNWRVRLFRQMNQLGNETHANVFDSLINFETMQYFNAEKAEIKRFEKAISKYEKAAISISTSLGWLNFGQGLILSIGIIIIMIMSSHAVNIGQQSIGDFVFINALLSQLSIPLNIIGTIYRDTRQSFIEIEELFNILSEKIEIKNITNADNLKITKGTINFDKVFFSYNLDNQIIKGFSLEIPARKKTALIGKSGVGKSTISKLIYRLYDIQDGSISIDGHDIRMVTKESLREAIGIIAQDTVLFNDTLRYNILYGRPDASEKDLEAAVEVAHLKSFIMSLPNGYDTMVGERGLKLSGGEKQRVSIARAVIKNPPIMIFDEATSSLDTITERSIQNALDSLSTNRTTLIIAHRLSTIVNADVIVVLNEGKIAEQGNHKHLMSLNGIYSSMWKKQQEHMIE